MIRDTRSPYPPEYDDDGDIESCAFCGDTNLPEDPEDGTPQFDGFCSWECQRDWTVEWATTVIENPSSADWPPLAKRTIKDLCKFIDAYGHEVERRSINIDGERYDRRTRQRKEDSS